MCIHLPLDLPRIEYSIKKKPLAASIPSTPQNTTISTIIGMLKGGDIDGAVALLKYTEDRTGLEVGGPTVFECSSLYCEEDFCSFIHLLF